ncbi:MAG: hypothetical protein ACRDY6_17600, partial [Acidimicrobiia bacterium]
MSDRRWEFDDGLDPPDWTNGASTRSSRRTAPTRQGTVPPPRPPDPRFRPDRSPGTVDTPGSPPRRRRPAPRHDTDLRDEEDVDGYVAHELDELSDDYDGDHTDDSSGARTGRRAAERAARA